MESDRALIRWRLAVLVAVGLFAWLGASAAFAQDLEVQARGIARELRCPVCVSESVADSRAPLAVQMRELIRARLAEGESRDQILAYFADRYGETVLLSPPEVWLHNYRLDRSVSRVGGRGGVSFLGRAAACACAEPGQRQ